MLTEPHVKRAIAFVDCQNLYRHAKAAFGHHHPNFDILKLFASVCAANSWLTKGVRFYTGTPSKAESPMWHGYWSNRLLALRRSGVLVTSREIRYHKETTGLADGTVQTITFAQEKGIDIRLALDLVRLARQGQYDVGVVFSQDQDLAEAIAEVKDIAKERQVWIKLVSAYPCGPAATSSRGINGTDWFKMDQTFYDANLDPHDYRPAKTT